MKRVEMERERCALIADQIALQAALDAQREPPKVDLDQEWWQMKQHILNGIRHAAVEIAAKIRNSGG